MVSIITTVAGCSTDINEFIFATKLCNTGILLYPFMDGELRQGGPDF